MCDLSAYICGERGGLIVEDPHPYGASLNGVPGLDIDTEKRLVQKTLNQLREEGATKYEIEVAMKNLGIKRCVNFMSAPTILCTRDQVFFTIY